MKIDGANLIARVEAASTLLAAMASPKRLMILCELLGGECSVNELSERLGVRQSTVSQHLSLLRKDGLVVARRAGQTQFYSLEGHEARTVLATLHRLYCARSGDGVNGSGNRAVRRAGPGD